MNELNPKLSEILTQFEFYCWVLLLFQFNLYNICSFTTTCVPLLSFWKESSSFCSYFPVFFPLRGFAHLLLTQTNLKGVTNCQIHFLLLPELAGIFDTLFFSPLLHLYSLLASGTFISPDSLHTLTQPQSLWINLSQFPLKFPPPFSRPSVLWFFIGLSFYPLSSSPFPNWAIFLV